MTLLGKLSKDQQRLVSSLPQFVLGDDGTLDTVVLCQHCGKELRYNFDADPQCSEAPEEYAAFVDFCLADASEDHHCGEDDA